jgi:hypothetical protein
MSNTTQIQAEEWWYDDAAELDERGLNELEGAEQEAMPDVEDEGIDDEISRASEEMVQADEG